VTYSPRSGVSALPFTYPFEVIRVRMALQTRLLPPDQRSVWYAINSIYNEPSRLPLRLLHFYRGFAVSLLGTIPYRGGIFMVWETLKSQSLQHFTPEFRENNRHRLNLAMGAIAGTTSQIVTYPLEVIRRYQQASGKHNAQHFVGFRETIRIIWLAGGWRGFYAGLGVGLIKQVPMHSISLATWQAAKRILEI
jgi:solute carrier family 25 (mitochondrial carrier protein), member 16